MSILIKGMKMPKDNPVTINIYRDGSWVNAYTRENGKAIEVPPHGRLIDADKLRAEFPHPNDWRNPELAYAHLSGIWATIDCAETIIEAEEET